MKIFARRFLFVLICICLCCFGLAGCGEEETGIAETENLTAVIAPMDNAWLDEISQKTKSEDSVQLPDYNGGDTMNVGITAPVTYINPFYARNDGEKTAAGLIAVNLIERDREGTAILSGVSGETWEYNGNSYSYDGIADVKVSGNTYTITLNEDIYFSDGVNLTADDVIFSMYVLADPAYDGAIDFAQLPIVGMSEYRTGMQQKWRSILSDLKDSGEYNGSTAYTKEDFDAFLEAFNSVGEGFVREIVSKSVDTFAEDYSDLALNRTSGEVMSSEGLSIAFAEYFCGYASGFDDSQDGLWYDNSGRSYDLSSSFPTVQEFWELITAKHGYDLSEEGINYEKLGEKDFEELLIEELDTNYPQLTVAAVSENSPETITGIEKTGMYSLKITFTDQSAEYADGLSIPVCPLHYYGSREEYKYTENKFGFSKGNLMSIKALAQPLGAGAYVFEGFEGENADFSRNALYFRGCPKITNIRLRTEDPDIIAVQGSGGTLPVDSDRFEYLGINSQRVSVGDAASDASVSLRRAFCTMFEEYRSTVELSGAKAIEYPAATVSWTSDNETGNALDAAVELLKQAGYTWDENGKRFLSAPEGASTSYELRIYEGDMAADVVKAVADAMSSIGITLNITEHTSTESLKNFVSEGGADMWILQGQGGAAEVLKEMFYSSGSQNVFNLSLEELDKGIENSGYFLRRNVRNANYRTLLSIPMNQGLVVPLFAEMDSIACSDRIVTESIASDMTLYWTWINEVWKLEMK